MSTHSSPSAPSRSALERLLGVITEVRPGEAATSLLLTINIFVLFTAYYIIKPVRDALIVSMPGGAEYKAYMGGFIAVVLLFAVPLYASFARRLPRNRLVIGAILLFASNLALFAAATQMPSSERWLPLVFYVWVGIFNMMGVAQFWAFANDIYNEEQGKRLFALIGVGASLGSVVGGGLAKWLPLRPETDAQGITTQVGHLGLSELLMLSGTLLVVCAVLTQLAHRRELPGTEGTPKPLDKSPVERAPEASKTASKTASKGPYALVFRHRYLTLIAVFSLLFTLVNTNGEYMIGRLVRDHVFAAVGAREFADEAMKKAFISGMFTSWYGDFYFFVNLVGFLLQSLVVSRLVKWGGIRAALLLLPVIALLGATAVFLLPALLVLRPSKIAENATDYSVNNTARNMLWLPTTKEMKYQAKQAVDTFFVRMGDVGSGLLVFAAVELLHLDNIRWFAGINVVLVVGWLIIALKILKEKDVFAAKNKATEGGAAPA